MRRKGGGEHRRAGAAMKDLGVSITLCLSIDRPDTEPAVTILSRREEFSDRFSSNDLQHCFQPQLFCMSDYFRVSSGTDNLSLLNAVYALEKPSCLLVSLR